MKKKPEFMMTLLKDGKINDNEINVIEGKVMYIQYLNHDSEEYITINLQGTTKDGITKIYTDYNYPEIIKICCQYYLVAVKEENRKCDLPINQVDYTILR